MLTLARLTKKRRELFLLENARPNDVLLIRRRVFILSLKKPLLITASIRAWWTASSIGDYIPDVPSSPHQKLWLWPFVCFYISLITWIKFNKFVLFPLEAVTEWVISCKYTSYICSMLWANNTTQCITAIAFFPHGVKKWIQFSHTFCTLQLCSCCPGISISTTECQRLGVKIEKLFLGI